MSFYKTPKSIPLSHSINSNFNYKFTAPFNFQKNTSQDFCAILLFLQELTYGFFVEFLVMCTAVHLRLVLSNDYTVY